MTSIAALLISDNVAVLRQGKQLVEDLDGPVFTANSPTLSLSGVGPHLRHVIDFYERFLGALERRTAAGAPLRVDYDARDRDPRIETDSEYAAHVVARTIDRLRALPDAALEVELEVRSDGSPWVRSTVERELQSLVTHTVHHYALIAVAVRSHGGDPGSAFGVAPSTIRHWQAQRTAEAAASR